MLELSVLTIAVCCALSFGMQIANIMYVIKRDAKHIQNCEEIKRLRSWLIYIEESDPSACPGGFHNMAARKALNGESIPSYPEKV